ncbi:hypothetical protein ACFC0M_10570 [Streptomyces sp. NPDC056149]|uniref:hypothetical protein n=1 Tax=unclassified Streptomyces TaxID=2593676 RepID=UPI0023814EAA|nr:hypothetical protein [Streptomyces sp. WZ-12]
MRSLARVVTAAAILAACVLPAASAQAAPPPAGSGHKATHATDDVHHDVVDHVAGAAADTVKGADDLLGRVLTAAGARL